MTEPAAGRPLLGVPLGEIERRGLSFDGPAREVYVQTPFDGPDARWIVELQQPVA